MSIDLLHEKIRKLKNPSMVSFGIKEDAVPPHILAEEPDFASTYVRFCRELLQGLKGVIPAVRFSFTNFALLDSLSQLSDLMKQAKQMGYYVLLDSPEIASPWSADRAADTIFGADRYPCDGLVISPYIGTDAIKPFLPYCRDDKKDLFVVLRSPNKSASELQDLLTGTRLVHYAAADIVSRLGEAIPARCGYSRICAAVSAGSADSIRTLRNSYRGMFLLVDGLDYPSGNHKNCSYAFDRMGYGAVVCAGPSVTAAWKEMDSDGTDYVQCAQQAAERMKKNLTRYFTVL